MLKVKCPRPWGKRELAELDRQGPKGAPWASVFRTHGSKKPRQPKQDEAHASKCRRKQARTVAKASQEAGRCATLQRHTAPRSLCRWGLQGHERRGGAGGGGGGGETRRQQSQKTGPNRNQAQPVATNALLPRQGATILTPESRCDTLLDTFLHRSNGDQKHN
jgi:hypothetical protein